MTKLQKQQRQLEEQWVQQDLDEKYLSGKNYGVQAPIITKTKAKGRKITINAHCLASAIKNAIKKKETEYVNIQLAEKKILAIDLRTLEALYFNDKTCEETYLDNITFYEE